MVPVEKKKKKLRGAVKATSNLACHQNLSRKMRIHKRSQGCGLNVREEVNYSIFHNFKLDRKSSCCGQKLFMLDSNVYHMIRKNCLFLFAF